MQEATLVLGMVLQRFKLIDHTRYKLKIKEALTIKPEGFKIKVRPRTDRAPMGEVVGADRGVDAAERRELRTLTKA